MTPDDDSSVRDSAADKLLTGLSLLPPRAGAPADDVALLAGLDVGSIAAGSTERALAVLTETGAVIESDGLFRLAAATRTSLDEDPFEPARRAPQGRYVDRLRGLCGGRWSTLPAVPGRAARLLQHMVAGARLGPALELISERDDSGALARVVSLTKASPDPEIFAARAGSEIQGLRALLPLAGRGLERLHAELRVSEYACALRRALETASSPSAEGKGDQDSPTDTDAHSQADTDTDIKTDSNTDIKTDSNTDSNTDSDRDSEDSQAFEVAVRLALASPDDVTMIHALAPLLGRVRGARRTAMIERFLLSLRALLGVAGDELGPLLAFAVETLPPEFRERHAADMLRRCGASADPASRAGLVAALAPFLGEESRLRELMWLRREVPEPISGRVLAALVPWLPSGILDELVWPVMRIADRDARVAGLLSLLRRIAELGYERLETETEAELAARPDQVPAFLALVEARVETRTADVRTAPIQTIEARPMTIHAPALHVRTRPDQPRRDPILLLLEELGRCADSFLLGLGLAELAPILPDWTTRPALTLATAIPQRSDRLEALIPLAARLPDAERDAFHDATLSELREPGEPESDVYLLARLAEHRPWAEQTALLKLARERLATIPTAAERARMAFQIASRCDAEFARALIAEAVTALGKEDVGSQARLLEDAAAIDLRLPPELLESLAESLDKAPPEANSATDPATRLVALASLARLAPPEHRPAIADRALGVGLDPALEPAFVIQELAPLVSAAGRQRLVATFEAKPDMTGAAAARVALVASLAAQAQQTAFETAPARAQQTGDAEPLVELIGAATELDEPALLLRLRALAPDARALALHALIERHQARADDGKPLDFYRVEEALIAFFRTLPEVSPALRDSPELDVSSIYLPLGGFRFCDRMMPL